MADWFVGQKVVCVDMQGRCHNKLSIKRPVVGSVYSIRGIVPSVIHEGVGFLLEEISNEPSILLRWTGRREPCEPAFADFRFRPVVERRTDISLFHRMLNPSSSPVKENA